MAGLLDDLVLLPHCDLHVALTGTPPLTLRVFRRTETAGVVAPYTLEQVPPADVTFTFMAPYRATGDRFDGLPTVGRQDGVVQPNEIGVFLFQASVGNKYLVGRLQVHQRMEEWWFGNDTITTALDSAIGHALPSVYARFSDDDNATDLVGDISGHGYVTLTSQQPSQVEVTEHGRLRGLIETPKPPPGELPAFTEVTGTFGTAPARTLLVGVVDYAKERRTLLDHHLWDVRELDHMQNIVLLAEGFEGTAHDRDAFTEAADTIVADMFGRRRHEPYGTLKERFNVFSAFEESFQRGLTVGHRVTDTLGNPPNGSLIPYEGQAEPARPNNRDVYTVAELVHRVGLPPRIDVRPDLVEVWKKQGLTDFNPARVNAALIRAWKTQRSLGILQATDSFFGVIVGCRPADRLSGLGVVPKPAQDKASDPAMVAFVRRLYEFYDSGPTGLLSLDPRRHPPELYAGAFRTNPLNSIVRYATKQSYVNPYSHSHHQVGQVWAPDDENFRRSRGLIAIVACDFVGRGVNTNLNTMTLQAFRSKTQILYRSDPVPPGPPVMRRSVPAPKPGGIPMDDLIDTFTHELGHNFNLGDEYEELRGDGAGATASDLTVDNVTRLGHARRAADPDRSLDLTRIKWLTLPRMKYSARLVKPSDSPDDVFGIRVTIDPTELADWRTVQKGENLVCLRRFSPTREGRQLPLNPGTDEFLENLNIGHIDPGAGTLVLTGAGLPGRPYPVFATGSLLYVPLKDARGTLLTVVDDRVLAALRQRPAPMNRNPERVIPNRDSDTPRNIPGLTPREHRRTLIGIYEGAEHFAGAHYRPSGVCKMRAHYGAAEIGSFCFVCMWLLVNRIDPGRHAYVGRMFYPGRRP